MAEMLCQHIHDIFIYFDQEGSCHENAKKEMKTICKGYTPLNTEKYHVSAEVF